MGIQTIVANISCASLENSLPSYEKLFGTPPTRRPMDGLAEWRFTDSAEVQIYENKANAGKRTLTIGVRPLEPEHDDFANKGLSQNPASQPMIFSWVFFDDSLCPLALSCVFRCSSNL